MDGQRHGRPPQALLQSASTSQSYDMAEARFQGNGLISYLAFASFLFHCSIRLMFIILHSALPNEILYLNVLSTWVNKGYIHKSYCVYGLILRIFVVLL